ncbi:hypothetical protein VTK56DRAFT_10110 [Thermocarpiscus australiensis]
MSRQPSTDLSRPAITLPLVTVPQSRSSAHLLEVVALKAGDWNCGSYGRGCDRRGRRSAQSIQWYFWRGHSRIIQGLREAETTVFQSININHFNQQLPSLRLRQAAKSATKICDRSDELRWGHPQLKEVVVPKPDSRALEASNGRNCS